MTPLQPTLYPPEWLPQAGWKPHALPGHMGQVGPLWSQPQPDGGWHYGLLAQTRHLNPAGMVHGGVGNECSRMSSWQHTEVF